MKEALEEGVQDGLDRLNSVAYTPCQEENPSHGRGGEPVGNALAACSTPCPERLRSNHDCMMVEETSVFKHTRRLTYLADFIIVFILATFAMSSYLSPSLLRTGMAGITSAPATEVKQTKDMAEKEEPIGLAKSPALSDETPLPEPDKAAQGAEKKWTGIKTERSATSKKGAKKGSSLNSISQVRGVGKRLSITFDGGWSDASANEILDVLHKKEIKTTFFLAGSFIGRYPETVKRIVAEGHEVGNHTMTHPRLTTYALNRKNTTAPGMGFERFKKELEETARLFQAVTASAMIPYWRAPYGEINAEILQWASEIGYQHVGWTVDYKAKRSMDSLDWVADKSSSLYLTSDEIKMRLLAFADQKESASGGIILMHLGTEREEDILHEKLEDIIDSFMARGYQMVPFSNLLRIKNSG